MSPLKPAGFPEWPDQKARQIAFLFAFLSGAFIADLLYILIHLLWV